MNIAYIKDIKKTNFNFDNLTDDFKLCNRNKNVDILLHRGDFGIEPCAYVIGKDAVDVVKKILKIRDELK
jgi:predicted fused transcriptional regulator/phosphomethylpyrimidine kinase